MCRWWIQKVAIQQFPEPRIVRPFFPQRSKVAGNRQSKILATRRKNVQLPELGGRKMELLVVSDALQQFAENEIRNGEPPAGEFPGKPEGMRIPQVTKKINPNASVNDNHCEALPQPRRISPRLPGPYLAACGRLLAFFRLSKVRSPASRVSRSWHCAWLAASGCHITIYV